MPNPSAHVPQWTLELLAEDALPPGERSEALAHVERCPRCAAELDASRTLLEALSTLPRFAPSAAFGEAVMARVELRPRTAFARVRRWLPATRKGWMVLGSVLAAPFFPVIFAAAWIFSRPLVTVSGLWTMGAKWLEEAGWWLVARLVALVMESGLLERGKGLGESLWVLLTGDMAMVGIILALATPVAAWALGHLLRTPMGDAAHAH